jgi:hypothetical protein
MLNTGVSYEENVVIRDFFAEKYGVLFSIVKNNACYRLRCGTKVAKQFIEIVRPFIIPSMRYKIDLQYSATRALGAQI